LAFGTTYDNRESDAWQLRQHNTLQGQPRKGSAIAVPSLNEGRQFHLIINAIWEPLNLELPKLALGNTWRRWIDTALDCRQDIVNRETAPSVAGETYPVAPRSVVMLLTESAVE
jgi:isoamylase